MSGRQKTKRSPTRRHRKAEAAVAKTPSPLTPEQLQQLKQRAVRQAVAEMQDAINQAIAEEREEWLRATGRPMPMNVDDCVIEARIAGFTAAEAEAGDFRLDAIKRQATAEKILRDQQVEGEARARLAVVAASPSPWPPVDSPERIANEISSEFRKVLATLHEGGAMGLADCMKRPAIEDRSGLTGCRVRHVLQQQSRRITPSLIETRTGAGGGVWLTAEGSLVASLIDKNILPRITIPPQKKSIR